MPELLGVDGDKVRVHFPKARKHIPGQGSVPNPHEKLMDAEDLGKHITAIEAAGKDPSFFKDALDQLNGQEPQAAPHNPKTKLPSGPGGLN